MTILGAAITATDVVADPRYSHYNPNQVPRTVLSSYTLEQKGKYDEDSLKLVNTMKEEFGLGVSSLVRIYNASGRTLYLTNPGYDWHGHMFRYPPDSSIENGQWSVFLHVKTSGAATGSESCVIYNIQDEGDDVFMGWSVPWNQSSWTNTIYTEIREGGHWPGAGSWDLMQRLLEKSSKFSDSTWKGNTASFKCVATIADDTSPQVIFTVTAV